MNAKTFTKNALLSAAKDLLGESGYAGTSVRDIASASGANVAAVNYHFGSREKLLNQAVLESLLTWTDRLSMVSQADQSERPAERLLASLRAVVSELTENEQLFAIFLEATLHSRRSPALHDQLVVHYEAQRRRVVAMVKDAFGEALPERTAEVIASLMVAVTDGLLLQSLVDPRSVPSAEEIGGLMP